MNRFLLIVGLCGLLLYATRHAPVAEDYRDAAAVDLAVATMTDGAGPAPSPPSPYRCPRCQDTGWITHGDGHKTPCPDCQSGSAGEYGGPLDMYRDAKELIRKGNELADRGKAILDQAERSGKITVDIQLPKPAVTAAPSGASCSSGTCQLPTSPPADPGRKTTGVSTSPGCTGGMCRPGLFRRWRR